MQGFTGAQEETGEMLGRDVSGGVTNCKDLGAREGEQAIPIPPFMLPLLPSFQVGRPGGE